MKSKGVCAGPRASGRRNFGLFIDSSRRWRRRVESRGCCTYSVAGAARRRRWGSPSQNLHTRWASGSGRPGGARRQAARVLGRDVGAKNSSANPSGVSPTEPIFSCISVLASVTAAGGWKGYYYTPHKDMLVLRELCHRGRATNGPRTPEVVARLFAAAPRLEGAVDTRRRTRRARALEISRTRLPAPVFFVVLQYWLGTPFFPWVARG